MTPKEKAEELFDKYWNDAVGDTDYGWLRSKQCALIAVDEILEIKSVDRDYELSNYWQEVKQEIEAL